MEKFKFSLATAIAAMLILFTSCLGDKNNESNGMGYGLIAKNNNGKYLLYGVESFTGLPIYSEAIENYAKQYLSSEEQKFVYVSYKVNYDDEANSGYGSRGYVVGDVDIIDADIKTDSYVYSRSQPIDEEVAVENEVKPTKIKYLDLYSFLLFDVDIANYYKNDDVEFYLEYSPEQEADLYNGYNAYSVYVRIKHTLASTTESRSVYSEKRQFDLSDAISNLTSVEKRKSTSKGFYLQIKYLSDLDTEGKAKFDTLIRLLVSLSDE